MRIRQHIGNVDIQLNTDRKRGKSIPLYTIQIHGNSLVNQLAKE